MLFVQKYSEKSVTTMKPSGVHFYLLQVTILNLSEEARKHKIISRALIVAYLPAGNMFELDFDDDTKGTWESMLITIGLCD